MNESVHYNKYLKCPETETSSFYLAHLNRFHLKTEKESGPETSCFQIKDCTTENVQNCDSYTNVCARIVGEYLVSCQVLPHRRTENHYQNYLTHDHSKLLDNVPLAVIGRIWNIYDDAPAHFCRAVRDVLSNTYH
jgi:hypothetical protein